MPYDNVSPDKQDEMERCVQKVMGEGKDKEAAIAICYTSIMGKSINPGDLALDELKIGAAISRANRATIQAAHDALTKVGAVCQAETPDTPEPEDDMPEAEMMSAGNALKAISQTDDELRVANYIVLFGGRDLTGVIKGKNADGSSGEFFSPRTDFESDYTKTGTLHVDFEHGLDQDGTGNNRHNVLGYVDWKTARVDEKGVFVQRVLNRRNKYMQFLEELVKEGLVGNSTETIPGQAAKAKNGEITRWPLYRDTLTVMPMEPRMLTQNAMQAVKALAEIAPSLKSLITTTPEAASDSAAAPVAQASPILSTPIKDFTMELTQEQLENLMANQATKAVEAYRKSEPAASTPAVVITKDEAEQPFKSAGEFFQAVKNAAIYPRDEDKRLRPLKANGMSEGVPADGGYLVAPSIASGIVERMYTGGQILSRVTKDNIGPNSNGMIYNGIDETTRVDGSRYGGLYAYWLAEAGSKTATKPKFRQVELKLKKLAALCYATDELLADATALQSWLERTVPQELTFRTEDAIYEGDGVGKPLGIMNSPALITVTRDTAATVTATDVLTMWSRRWAGVNDYVWLINQDVMPKLALMSGTYQNIFLPPGGLSGSMYNTLLGKPIIEVEFASSLNTKGDIMLASLSQYQAILKGGVESASSIHVAFTTDETVFRFVYRIDGAPLWHSPLTPFKGSNTQSPFVVLGSASA